MLMNLKFVREPIPCDQGIDTSIQLTSSIIVFFQLRNGLLEYRHPQKTAILSHTRLDDGAWHHVQAQWLFTTFRLVLDYGQVQVSDCTLALKYRQFSMLFLNIT